MKKLIALSIVLVMLCGAVFAQDAEPGIKLGAWGRMATTLLHTYGYHNKDVADAAGLEKDEVKVGDTAVAYTAMGTSWGGIGRVGVNIIGSAKDIGFQLDLCYDNLSAAAPQDFAYIWATPIDWVKVAFGKMNQDSLRGNDNATDTAWQNFGSLGAIGQDNIFARYQSNNGWFVELTPPMVEGLTLQVGLGSKMGDYDADAGYKALDLPGMFFGSGESTTETKDEYVINQDDGSIELKSGKKSTERTNYEAAYYWRAIQAGAGYNLPGIGLIRLQFIGSPYHPEEEFFGKSENKIQLAYRLDSGIVSGLSLDVGLTGFIPQIDSKLEEYAITYWKGMKFALSGSYALDAINIGFGASGTLVSGSESGKTVNEDGDDVNFVDWDLPGWNIRLEPTYALEGIGTIGLTVGVNIYGTKMYTEDGSDKAADLYDKKNVGQYLNQSGDKTDYANAVGAEFAAGLYYKKALAAGSFQVGVGAKFDTDKRGGENGNGEENFVGTTFYIPVILEYSF